MTTPPRPRARAAARWSSLRTSPSAQLGLAAFTIGVLFGVVLVAPQPLWAGQPQGPAATAAARAAAAPALEPLGWIGALIAAVFVIALCLPFRPYARAMRVAATNPSPRAVCGLTAALALVALLIYPRFGSDIFDYVGFERTWVVYGENPLTAIPSNHPTDWATPLVWYPDQPPAYGPLWAILTWPIVRLAGDSPTLAVLGYKLFSAAAYAACCALVWAIVAPCRRARALVLFAWSPLVLFEVLGKVHNDILIALGGLIAMWLVARGRRSGALTVSVAAALGKLTALAVAPPIALSLWRARGWRALLVALLGAAILAALIYAPFWVGPASVQPLLHQTGRVVWSPGTLVLRLAGLLPGGAPDETGVRALLVAVWLGACGLILRRAALETAPHTAATSAWLLLASLLLLTTAVFGHYFVPAVALAAVSADARLERTVFWLSIGGLAAYGVELLALVFGPDWIGSTGYLLTGSLVLLVPVLLASLLAMRRPRAHTPTSPHALPSR